MKKGFLYSLLLPLGLFACAGGDYGAATSLDNKGIALPTQDNNFVYCHAHGCLKKNHLALTPDEWQVMTKPFEGIQTADDERRAIAQSIGVFEGIVAQKIPLDDIGGTFPGFGKSGQTDCVDESMNTSSALVMLEQQGVLKYHTVGPVALRGYFFKGWPHQTATVIDTQTKERYAVDSWFFPQAHRASIVPLDRWTDGWSPKTEPTGNDLKHSHQ